MSGYAENRRRRNTPFYRRRWFWVPLVVLMVLACVGAIAGWIFLQQFRKQAETYDLAQVGRLPSASFIYDRNGRVIGQIYIENRYVIPLAEMPKHLQRAVMAAEDARFYEHDGVDLYGIVRAVVRNALAGETQQGASSITQQLARNTYGLTERTYKRKLVEAFLAWRIDDKYDKDRIMQDYLNLIFFGRGFHGVEAAARGYYGKNAKDLTIAESAALAGLIASPNNREPWNNPNDFKNNRDRVIGRMRELGYINRDQYKTAMAEPMRVIERVPIKSQSYILDYVRQKVIDIVGWEGATRDGFHVYTTIDLDVQAVAQTALEKSLSAVEKRKSYKHQTLPEYKKERDEIVGKAQKAALASAQTAPISPFTLVKVPDYLQGSAVVLENKTGGILAMVGGREFEHSEFNRAVVAKRPSGTGFLPMVYAAAFENGFFPGALVQDGVMDNRRVMIGGDSGILGEWGPESMDNRYEGKIPARFALMKSKNAAGVRVGYATGLDNVIKTAQRMGIQSQLPKLPSTYLGAPGTSLLEMALAYTNFPNGGWHEQQAQIVNEIRNSKGSVIFTRKSNRQRGLDEMVAYQVHSCLSDALHVGTGARAEREFGLKPFEGGGKTGTAYNFTDLSFFGYSSEVTCAVWAGFDAHNRQIYPGAFSSEIVLPIWTEVMNAANDRFPPKAINVPLGLEKIEVCLRSGELATDKCFETRAPEKEGQEGQRWRSTYIEYTTPEQKPRYSCRPHTGAGLRMADLLPQDKSGARMALPVVSEEQVPVQVASKTIIGISEDPYHSMKPIDIEKRVDLFDGDKKNEVELPAKEILRATPVGPLDNAAPDSTQMPRPEPLDLDRLGN